MQKVCFDEGDKQSCTVVSTEMSRAAQLFKDLATATKATSMEAMRRGGGGGGSSHNEHEHAEKAGEWRLI